MAHRFTTILLLCACGILTTTAAAGPEASGAGRPASAAAIEILPHSIDALPYDKLLIEPVEISYDAASPYQGAKHDRDTRIGEAAAKAIRTAVGEKLKIVDEPGPGVLRVRAAITNVYGEPKPKTFLSYTPFGLIKTRVDAAKARDFVLISATIQVALYDGESGRPLAAVADFTGDDARSADADLSFRTLVAKVSGWTRRLMVDLAAA